MHRILLVSHDPAMFNSLCLVLKKDDSTNSTLEEVKKSDQVLSKIIENTYDLLILDLLLPHTDILGFIGKIKGKRPDLPIITYSHILEYAFIRRYLTSGINSYCFLNKNNCDEIVHAVNMVMSGKLYISPAMVELIVKDALFGKKPDRFDTLNTREFDVLTHLVRGESLAGIAEIFNVHTTTIVLYKSRIMDKLRITNLLELGNLVKM